MPKKDGTVVKVCFSKAIQYYLSFIITSCHCQFLFGSFRDNSCPSNCNQQIICSICLVSNVSKCKFPQFPLYNPYAPCMVEGSLEVKRPTIWTDEKQSRAEAERRERLEERRSEKRKSQKKEDADARKGRKVAKHCVFQMICGSEGQKVGCLKRRVRSQLAR